VNTTLKNLGLKVTPQRMNLLECLESHKHKHPSFNELYECMSKSFPSFSRSTLHSNLKTLEEKSLITTFNHNNETRYELNKKLHINLITKDGTIQDIYNTEIEQYLEKIKEILSNKNNKIIKKFVVLVEVE
jgi:Fe2+ or Zn2+ uptake regulation protein